MRLIKILILVLLVFSSCRNTINGYEYVDLGLPSGLKWATCNIGASSPEDFGDYYAWGEIETKRNFSTRSYEHHEGKYIYIGKNISGSKYDVASSEWGKDWRLPKEREFKELIEYCEWKWVKKEGVSGYKIIGPNGNSIFLPASGRIYNRKNEYEGLCGNYWTGTHDKEYTSMAIGLLIEPHKYYLCNSFRTVGRSVRPVSE